MHSLTPWVPVKPSLDYPKECGLAQARARRSAFFFVRYVGNLCASNML